MLDPDSPINNVQRSRGLDNSEGLDLNAAKRVKTSCKQLSSEDQIVIVLVAIFVDYS